MLLSGYRLNENKRIFDSLQKIYGIGSNKASQILSLLGLKKNILLKDILIKIFYFILYYMVTKYRTVLSLS